MKKTANRVLLVLAVLFLIGACGLYLLKKTTKKHSPEQEISFTQDGLQIDIFYCSPSAKGRMIFGGLVPFGEVWRTGANEPTTITTNRDLLFGDQVLAAGKHTIFTIPKKEAWQVIFNKGEYNWGLNWDDSSPRDPSLTETLIHVPVQYAADVQESFTINISGHGPYVLDFAWDKTRVQIPFKALK